MTNARRRFASFFTDSPRGRCVRDSAFTGGVVQPNAAFPWRASVSLYIRLDSSFWNHRKTLRLHSIIGDAAFWIPPKLWCYAATNQPNGDFSEYTETELSLIIGFRDKDPHALVQALITAGFMDADRKLHNWKEWNAYHNTFANRARKAAIVRWSRKDKDNERIVKGKEKSKHSLRKDQALLKHNEDDETEKEW